MRGGVWLCALVMAFAMAVPPATAEVGKTSVVQGEPKGKPPNETERVLKIGNDLQADERVTTMKGDRAHVVFLDNTSLTIGPDSVVVLDKFVFDPNRGVGEMSLSTVKGSMRFVGGLVSKTSTVTVKSPTATMGIRGGIAVFIVSPSGTTTAGFLFGAALTVTSQGVTQTALPNFQITVEPGQPPSPPVPIPPGSPIIQFALDPGAAPSTAAPGDTLAAAQRAAINQALGESGLAQLNSGVAPDVALANLALARQAQWSFGIGVRLTSSTAQSQGTTPLVASRPLQSTDPLSDAGPLATMGPLQSSGPLQGMGPLVSALPLQDVGPIQIPDMSDTPPGPTDSFAANLPPPGYQAPPLSPVEITDLATGSSAMVNQALAQLLAGGNPSPAILQQVVEALSSSPPTSYPSAISQPTGPTGSTFPAFLPGQLPPTVFQPTEFVSPQ